jgi:copper chaperone
MIEFQIPAMSCGHCISMIAKAVKDADPAATVECDLPTHTVRVETTEDRDTVAAALEEAGYAPQ